MAPPILPSPSSPLPGIDPDALSFWANMAQATGMDLTRVLSLLSAGILAIGGWWLKRRGQDQSHNTPQTHTDLNQSAGNQATQIHAGGNVTVSNHFIATPEGPVPTVTNGEHGAQPGRSQVHPADIKLFEAFQILWTRGKTLTLLRDHSFAGTFRWDWLDDLDEFYQYWNDAAHTFIDPDLEGKRSELHAAVGNFLQLAAANTFRTDSGLQEVPAEWQWKQPERHKRVVTELDQLANNLVDAYENLILSGRLRLGVAPILKSPNKTDQ